ncbi:MAG: 30S ribosomal protein S6 [Puniceicoccales bacterium]|nr:30S ribosomal protein S6 [Puniceicoccales bacterium]
MYIKSYRATMILDTRHHQDSVENLIANIKAKIAEAGATIGEIINKGQIKFQRATDRKFPAGIYLQIAFEGPTTAPEMVRSKFSLDSTVNRIFIESK